MRYLLHNAVHALTCLGLIAALATNVGAQGLTPQQARDRMIVPEGFKVEVFASEPEIRQPVAACFDERGRMWVIEYLQYPNPAGLVPVKVDQYLRTEYDRVPEPPPKGPKGADRIKILEDTDGDGKADKVTTFAEGLNLASAIAVGHGGVWIGQAPYLLFFPDKDRDDKPDGDPVVKLAGFGLQDAHATLNSLTWGPDGWLYGAQGSTVTAKIRGIEFQQGIWRYHPKTDRFELFAEGGGNTWGVDFDRAGNLFGSSNGGFIAFHMLQGANYWKGFAKHGPLHNPRAYGYFDSIAYSGPKPGGHVTPGGIIYKGEQFPQEYRGSFLGANLLANNVYWYKLAPKGSTFSMTLGGTLLESRDPWFRPIDLLTGPDGSVYIVDWYDKRASHLDPRDTWDRSNGRIYKLSFGTPEKVPPFDLAKRPTHELIAMRDRPNDWWCETARRVLYERGDQAEVRTQREFLNAARDDAQALRDMFALNACGGLDVDLLGDLANHSLPGVRRWAARLMVDHAEDSPDVISYLVVRANREADPTVRSQLAASAARLPASNSLALISVLIQRDEDATDPMIPMQLWWGLERIMRADPAPLIARASGTYWTTRTVPRKILMPRVVRALADSGVTARLDLCQPLLDAAKSSEDREALLESMDRGLEGITTPLEPGEKLTACLQKLRASDPQSLSLLRVSARLNLSGAYADAIRRVADEQTSNSDRLALIALLGRLTSAEGRDALIALIRGDKDDAVVAGAMTALGNLGDASIAHAILARYPQMSADLRSRAIDTLATRKQWATILVNAIGLKAIPAADLKASQALRIAAFNDAELIARLENAWGRLPARDAGAKTRRIAEVRGILPEGDKGDPARGHAIFQSNCMACHRLFGEGERVGPELTGSERGDLDFLLTSLVDPSAVIRKEYQGQTLALKDGRVLTGLIVDEDGATLTLFDSQKQKATIPKAEIESRKASETSVMPEGLLDSLKEDQVRDLFRYLQSSGPSPVR